MLEIWTNTFTWEVWTLVLASMGLAVNLFNGINTLNLLYSIGVTLGQCVASRATKFLSFVIMCFFVRTQFENALTSIIVAPPGPILYNNLHEMTLDNVKIIFDSAIPGVSTVDIFEKDFQHAGILNRFNISFINSRDYMNPRKIVKSYLRPHVSKKFAIMLNGLKRNIDSYVYKMQLLEEMQGSLLNCDYMKQKFNPTFRFLSVLLMNQYWIIKSVRRLQDFGLMYQWDKWTHQLQFLFRKLIFRRTEHIFAVDERRFQLVKFQDLSAIFLIGLGIHCIAMALFLIQRSTQKQS